MAGLNIEIADLVEKTIEKIGSEGFFIGKWISCSERMPEIFDSVLLAILSKNDYGEPAYYVTIGGMKNGSDFESYTGDICECEKVTHWMPLPEPPEIAF